MSSIITILTAIWNWLLHNSTGLVRGDERRDSKQDDNAGVRVVFDGGSDAGGFPKGDTSDTSSSVSPLNFISEGSVVDTIIRSLKINDLYKKLNTEEARKIVESVARSMSILAIKRLQDNNNTNVSKDWEFIMGTINSLKVVSAAEFKNTMKAVIVDALPDYVEKIRKLW